MPIHLEDTHQKAVIDRAELTRVPNGPGRVGDFLFAIPNGGQRGKIEAARLKGLGVKAGISDMFLALPRGDYAGLWIEMKKPFGDFRCRSEADRAATPQQKLWLVKMSAVGYRAVLAYGSDAAWQAIEEYLALPAPDRREVVVARYGWPEVAHG